MSVHVELAEGGRIAVLTLARPEAKNALDPPMLSALAEAWRHVREDDSIRVAVLTGYGDAFCAGMDLKKTIPAAKRLAAGERLSDEEFAGLKAAREATLQVRRPAKPIVAAINGHCRGQGTDMLLATDYRIAAEKATFALEEVELGLFPRGNSTVMLPRQLGWARAVEMALHVRGGWDAHEALQAGLVNEVVEVERVQSRAMEVARRLSGFEPAVVQAILTELRNRAFGEDVEAAVKRSHNIGDEIMRE